MSKDGPQETEAYNNHLAFSQRLLAEYQCTKYPEHSLINWISGEPPTEMQVDGTSGQIPSTGMTSTSATSSAYI